MSHLLYQDGKGYENIQKRSVPIVVGFVFGPPF